jgi:hypothetical protein
MTMTRPRTSLGPPLAKQIAAQERNLARWRRREPKWPWRQFLTDEERETLRKAEAAKAAWLALNRERAAITNRAIQRAKYHTPNPHSTEQ